MTILEKISFTLYVLSLVLSITSVLFGIISWILLKKWRQFRHFAFLSFILAGTNFLTWMHVWSTMEILSLEFFITTVVILITHVQMTHWQMISTIMIHTAVVEVFNSAKVRCKYLLACLFSWVLPIIEGVMMILGSDLWVICWMIVTLIELSILLTNIVLYIKVVYNLVLLLRRQKISCREVCGKVLVATLACVIAGIPPVLGTILLMFLADYGPLSLLDPAVAMIPNLVNILLANVFFLSIKSHRLLWTEYIEKVREARAVWKELKMQLPSPSNETAS